MTLEQLRKKDWIIFEGIAGSHAYGMATETSDTDIRGIFIQPTNEVLAMRHIGQVSDTTNDVVFYEIGTVLKLLEKSNPNIIELLNLPEECVIKTSETYELLKSYADSFLTKQLRNTFGGYAVSQIKKAKGLNKKINWDKTKVSRKGVLDFCYVLKGKEESIKFAHFSKSIEYTGRRLYMVAQKFKEWEIGLAKVNNFPDLYSMYYLKEDGGIVSKGENESNDVQLRSIPKDAPHLGYMRFDRNAYSTHCKDYREYQEWLENRSEERYKDNLKGEIGYDHKNMSQCFRLLNMAEDIALGKGIVVKRPEREFLLEIRNGKYKYDELIRLAEAKIQSIDELFEKSDLPNKTNRDLVQDILLQIRLDNL